MENNNGKGVPELVLRCRRDSPGKHLEVVSGHEWGSSLICAEGCCALHIPCHTMPFDVVLQREEFPGSQPVDCRWREWVLGVEIGISRVTLPRVSGMSNSYPNAYSSWEQACIQLWGRDVCEAAGSVAGWVRVWVGIRQEENHAH